MGNFFSPLNPFALTPPFSFHPQSFFPSNLLFSPSTLSYLTLDPFFFTRLPLLGVLVGWLACCNASQISAAFGEKTGLCGFGCLVAWWATNAKQVSTAFGENTVWLLPFLFYPTSFGWCVGWFGLLGLLAANFLGLPASPVEG